MISTSDLFQETGQWICLLKKTEILTTSTKEKGRKREIIQRKCSGNHRCRPWVSAECQSACKRWNSMTAKKKKNQRKNNTAVYCKKNKYSCYKPPHLVQPHTLGRNPQLHPTVTEVCVQSSSTRSQWTREQLLMKAKALPPVPFLLYPGTNEGIKLKFTISLLSFSLVWVHLHTLFTQELASLTGTQTLFPLNNI